MSLKCLRMNGNKVGHWVEIFFLFRLNALAPPNIAFFQFKDWNHNSACNLKLDVSFNNLLRFIISE